MKETHPPNTLDNRKYWHTPTQMVLFWYAWPALPISQRPQEKLRYCIPHQVSTHHSLMTTPFTHTYIIYTQTHTQIPFITRMFCSQLSGPILVRSWTARWIASFTIKYWMNWWFPWVEISRITVFWDLKWKKFWKIFTHPQNYTPSSRN